MDDESDESIESNSTRNLEAEEILKEILKIDVESDAIKLEEAVLGEEKNEENKFYIAVIESEEDEEETKNNNKNNNLKRWYCCKIMKRNKR